MKKLLWIVFCLCLAGCALTDQERNKKDKHIAELEQRNKDLEQKKLEIIAQNKRLKDLSEKVLQRLAVIQGQHKKLIQENMELYQKLYSEGMQEQSKSLKDREKRIQQLEKEAQLLLAEVIQNKSKVEKLLMERRRKLIDKGSWTREDELKFVEVTRKLKSDLPEAEENKAVDAALSLESELARRLEQGSETKKTSKK